MFSVVDQAGSELRTETILLQENRIVSHVAASASKELSLREITNEVDVLYGGAQRLDQRTSSVALGLVIRNNGAKPITGPVYLKLQNPKSDFGRIVLTDAGIKGYVDVSGLS